MPGWERDDGPDRAGLLSNVAVLLLLLLLLLLLAVEEEEDEGRHHPQTRPWEPGVFCCRWVESISQTLLLTRRVARTWVTA